MNFRDNRGFLIVYVMIFLMVLAAIAGGIYIEAVRNAHRYVLIRESKIENEVKQLAVDFYKAHAFAIDSNPNDVLDTGKQIVTSYQQLASITGMSQRDAWNVPFILAISRRLTDQKAGFYYHDFYIIGAGPDHRYESTYDPTTNTLIKGGDDVVIKIDGRQIEGDYYVINKDKLFNLVKVIRNYVETLYLMSNKNKTLDFFMSSSCSAKGGGQFGCYKRTQIGDTNIPSLIGISPDMYRDAMGHDFYIDNYSNNVSTINPPYTARIGVLMPGGYINWVVFSYPM